MKAKKFTFKTEHPKGSYSSFFPSAHYIKLDKRIVGEITDRTFNIRLQVIKDDINEDKNPNSTWKWVELNRKSKTLQEAKDFLNEFFDAIIRKYNLYKREN